MNSEIQVRSAVLSDATWIAHVHIHSWLTSYRWIVDQNHLDNMKTDDYHIKKIEKWKEILARKNSYTYVAVVWWKIVWFVWWWKHRDEKLKVEWELYAIYILEEFKWKWIWWLLFKKMKVKLFSVWFQSFCLRALSENEQANWFYKYMWGDAVWKDVYIVWDKEHELAWWVFRIWWV